MTISTLRDCHLSKNIVVDILIDFIFNSKDYIVEFVDLYGFWVYALLFLIIFAETGFVIFPFLPGDGFVLTVGVVAGSTDGTLNIWIAIVLMIVAAFLGNVVNYHIGRYFGAKVLEGGKIKWVNQKHLDQTHEFFEKHGQKAVILSRFLPVFRTFVPFVAGISWMNRRLFISYTAVGGIAWVLLFGLTGYFLGNVPWVEKNLSFIFMFLVVVTIIPTITAAYRNWKKNRAEKQAAGEIDDPT